MDESSKTLYVGLDGHKDAVSGWEASSASPRPLHRGVGRHAAG